MISFSNKKTDYPIALMEEARMQAVSNLEQLARAGETHADRLCMDKV
jgi:hypothetical protein